MLTSIAPRDLYPGILGKSWDELSGAIRSAHQPGGEKTGCFRVTHGTGFLARRLACLAKLPEMSESAEVVLTIHGGQGCETWERRFGAVRFTTVQWSSEGCLVERFGVWELRFTLRVSDGALVYEQCAARLCLGALCLPVPLAFAPRVSAREEAGEMNQVRVSVSVSLPVFGRLIAYDGHLDVKDFAR